MKNIKPLSLAMKFILILTVISSCSSRSPFHGTWQYGGGVYDGKKQDASPDFKLQREYKDGKYEGFIIDGDQVPERFNGGVFEHTTDSLFITTNFNSQPSQMTGKTVKFQYKILGTDLTLNGTLPNGMVVEEYWKKIK